MPQFVQQATTYGYDKASPYIDIASKKVPLMQSVLNRFVPYAKPSVQLADKIVDAALGLASKPLELVQGTISSVNGKVFDCKTAVVTKASYAKGVASDKLSGCKTVAAESLQKYKSLGAEKSSIVVQVLQRYKVLATEQLKQVSSGSTVRLQALAARLRVIELKGMATAKFGQVSSGASAKIQALATRLHLIELRDSACCKGNALKESVIEMRDMGCHKGSAVKKQIIAVIAMVPGKAYSSAVRVVGKANIDSVLQMPAKYAPDYTVKKTE